MEKKKEVSEVDQGSDHQSLANNKISLLKRLQEIPAHYRDPVHRNPGDLAHLGRSRSTRHASTTERNKQLLRNKFDSPV